MSGRRRRLYSGFEAKEVRERGSADGGWRYGKGRGGGSTCELEV